MPQRTDIPHQRLSASVLPPEVEPAERDFMRLLEKALSPSYTLVKRVGAGGMGSVYLARDPVLKRLVAVKVMAPSLAADEGARARFEREAQSVASISHPNVVAVYSVGELENGVPYLVMQYIEGRTMAEQLAEDGPLDAPAAKRVIGEVASALAAAHKKGIIHRDIKPANILLDDDTGRAMVTDFGIAAVLERSDDRDVAREAVRITHTGMAIGTPAYMSPEQLLAEPITEKTDIYSLGLLGYELFIAEGPYQISSPRELMAAHLRDTPRKLSTMRADIDPELERLLEACLAKDPVRRPSAADVERRLAHGASILLEWPPPGLEGIAASFRSAVRILLAGAFMGGVPVVVMSVFERESFLRQTLPPTLVQFAIASIGFLIFLLGLEALRRFIQAGNRGVALGYGWGTVIEAAADVRGDTGAVIAGGREYAELTPAKRNGLRRNRLIAAGMRLLAGFAPVLGFAFAVVVASGWESGPIVVLWSSVLLAITLLVAARAIRWHEERTMGPTRRRLRSVARMSGGFQPVVQAWTTAFEHIRAGQWIGVGPTTIGRVVKGVLIATAAVSALAVGLIFTVQLLTTGFGTAASLSVPRFAATRAKVDRIRRLANYGTTPDSSITPLRAGQALHAITRNGPGALKPFEKQPAIQIPPQRTSRTPTDPFDAAEGGWQVMAFRRASRGYTAAERDFLRSTADNTALEEFRVMARARSLDLGAAYWDIGPGTGASLFDLPIPKFTFVTSAANANAAQAALDLAAGRRQEAEQRLRENISAGFLMINDGPLLIQNLVGANIVAKARLSLSALYDATGRAADARYVSAERDPDITIVELSPGRVSIEELNRELRRIVLDEKEIPGLRWEMLQAYSWAPCSDMHQVLFGADSLHRETIAEARRRLVRRPSEEQLFALLETSSVDPTDRRNVWAAHHPVARLVTALTGNRQLEGCLSLFGVR